jgi:hypothetical protein
MRALRTNVFLMVRAKAGDFKKNWKFLTPFQGLRNIDDDTGYGGVMEDDKKADSWKSHEIQKTVLPHLLEEASLPQTG